MIYRILIPLLLITSFTFAQSSSDVNSILEKYKNATSIETLSSKLTYKNISKKGRVQERSLKQYMLKNKNGVNCYNFLLQFTAPADVKNTAALTIQNESQDDDQWLYLPALRRAKRISARKKADRFMGTEMSYEDLSTYLSEPDEEYTYSLSTEEIVGERECFVLIADAKPSSPSQYSKRELWIDKETYILLKSEFYDKKNQLLKIYEARDIREIGGGYYRAHSIRFSNLQTKNSTEVSYAEFVINDNLDENLFSKAYIESL